MRPVPVVGQALRRVVALRVEALQVSHEPLRIMQLDADSSRRF